MTLRYTSDLPHQQSAINDVLELFDGQSRQEDSFSIFDGEAAVDNRLSIDETVILSNLQALQTQNTIEPSKALESLDFSIEMETGTGKTYVYIKTILELSVRYGWKKFLIVVPSIAIREGVLSSLESMEEHFWDELSVRYNHFEYSSERLNELKHFIRDDAIQIMVTTLDGFKRQNTLMQRGDLENFTASPLESLARTRPIVILDEPQNMESELSKEALGALNPLFTLRYSATHKNVYNLLYTLSPKDALDAGLVKKVFVVGISEEKVASEAYVSIIKIDRDKNKKLFVKLEAIVDQKAALVKKELTLKAGDDLWTKTKNHAYQGFVIDEINFAEKYISFENGIKLAEHETSGLVKKEIQKEQVRQAVIKHMQSAQKLHSIGVKPLCLFFVDRVANFLTAEEGWIESYFCEVFDELKKDYDLFRDVESQSVYEYYFAKRSKGYVDELKNNEADRKSEKEAYDLILKGKERLMRFDEPVSFIFSHSALKEGWDNPNVFTIATLNETNSDLKRRQILGRGLRLCVDASGNRIYEKSINRLCVVANESFQSFSENLQKEYTQSGVNGAGVSDEKTRQIGHKRHDIVLSEEFKKLWQTISRKTEYHIVLKSDAFVEKAVQKLSEMEFHPMALRLEQGSLDDGVEKESHVSVTLSYTLPDVVSTLCRHTGLTRQTIIAILEKVDLERFLSDLEGFIKNASIILNDEKASALADGIVYTDLKECWSQENIFDETIEDYDLVEMKRSLYDAIACDSGIEKRFAECADKRFALSIKLPKKFFIPTPLGRYSPDWAIVANDESKTCFVVETKGTESESELRGIEGNKIKCGIAHFKALNVDYKLKKECGTIALNNEEG